MLEFSSNAASAKVRGKFGKCLSGEDYRLLCGCKTVDEVASFLRSTPYGELMGRATAHREQIEYAVSRRIYSELESLIRYLPDLGGFLNGFFLGRYEIAETVKAATRLKGASLYDESDVLSKSALVSDSKVKFRILAVARTKEDIFEALKDTPHSQCALEFLGDDSMTVPQFEARLWGSLYDRVSANLKKHSSGKELESMKKLFSERVDVMNYVTAVRMLKYKGVSEEYLTGLMIKGGTFSEKTLRDMVLAENHDELFAVIKKTHIGKAAGARGKDAPIYAPIKEYIKYIRYCPYPAVVVAAYLFFIENEVGNIIKITEGIRYSLDGADIYGLLSVAE